jgi:hypothetical protein
VKPSVSVGTKSVLFGAHAFWLHPWFVAAGWWKLYGFPWHPALWVAFFLHDIGYIGKPNMDGPEGETHPEIGAWLVHKICDWPWYTHKWYDFTIGHSRFYAKKFDLPLSKLCAADKMAFQLTPDWLYLPMVTMTGEILEYMSMAKVNNKLEGVNGINPTWEDKIRWHMGVRKYMKDWIEEHKDCKADTWTPNKREAMSSDGVWR